MAGRKAGDEQGAGGLRVCVGVVSTLAIQSDQQVEGPEGIAWRRQADEERIKPVGGVHPRAHQEYGGCWRACGASWWVCGVLGHSHEPV